MKYYLISDTHFNHLKLEEWGDRSGDWQGELYAGIKNIPDGSTLIHLGDICIGEDSKVHELLFGHTGDILPHKGIASHLNNILVRGNHDKKSAEWYLSHGWDFVCDGFHLDYMGHMLLLTHRPMHPDMWRFTKNIHGHTHGNNHRSEEYFEWYTPEFHIDISPEVVGYQPLALDTLLKKYRI